MKARIQQKIESYEVEWQNVQLGETCPTFFVTIETREVIKIITNDHHDKPIECQSYFLLRLFTVTAPFSNTAQSMVLSFTAFSHLSRPLRCFPSMNLNRANVLACSLLHVV